MSPLRPQDRKSLCRFTFADGRQCRTPRSPGHPHLCSDHARKDSQARAADKLARDLSYFFSGQYLSACDLSAALGRLLPAVIRGDIKPRTAHTLAKPSILPKASTSTPSAPTPGARPCAIPSARTSITAALLRPPNRLRLRLLKPHQLNNRLRRRILPCLRRRPNLSSTYWPVGTCPDRISRPRPDRVGRRVKNHPPPNPFRSNTYRNARKC